VPVGLPENHSREATNNDVEGVLCSSTVGGRIRERIDDLELLDYRPRPAMRHNDWQSIWMLRANLNEVDIHVVDRCYELV